MRKRWGTNSAVSFCICHFQCCSLIACWPMAVFCTVHLVYVVFWLGCNMHMHILELYGNLLIGENYQGCPFGAPQRPKMSLRIKRGGYFQGLLFSGLHNSSLCQLSFELNTKYNSTHSQNTRTFTACHETISHQNLTLISCFVLPTHMDFYSLS